MHTPLPRNSIAAERCSSSPDSRRPRNARLPLLLAAVMLSGCAALPAVVEQASWALSGMSYLSTGKGPSDHALSVVARMDCSVLRVLLLRPLCVPVSEQTNESPLAALVRRLFGPSEPIAVAERPGPVPPATRDPPVVAAR